MRDGTHRGQRERETYDAGAPTGRQPSGGPRGAGAFPRELVPAVRAHDHVELLPQESVREVRAFTVQPGVNAFDSSKGNDVLVSANSTESDVRLTELEMPSGWLAQFRLVSPGDDIPDGIVVSVDQGGKQSPMFTTKNSRGTIVDSTATATGVDEAGTTVHENTIHNNLLEFYIWEDRTPYFTLENTTAGDLTVGDVQFSGFAYRLSPERQQAASSVGAEPIPTQRVRES